MNQPNCTNHPDRPAEWPSGNSPGDDLCQECWEAHCSTTWHQMMNAQNLADRIATDPQTDHTQLLALEATAGNIEAASPTLLEGWATEVLAVANGAPGESGQYWAQVAADLRSMAYEKMTGVGV